ncbi:MAG: ABC transporter permease [Ignavibacteriales bacterium]|nr:ABC transporter permease [Ignavibacteriales bacterium]
MSLERSIAFRYLVSKRKVGFVNVISVISIVGVTIGVAALVVVLSVFNGFNGLVTSILVSFDPHLRVEIPLDADSISAASLSAYLEQENEVSGFSPYVTGKALVVSRNINRVINVKGIDDKRAHRVSGLGEKIILGELNFQGRNESGVVIGLTLADRLGAVVGDTLSVISPAGSEPALLQIGQPLIRKYTVVGIYESNNKEYDAYYAYVGLKTAQTLFARGDRIDGWELRLVDFDETEIMKERLQENFGPFFHVLTWYDLHRELYVVMQIERWMAFVILSLIVGVASFNLLGSLTMSVLEKTRDIGILKALGGTRSMIRNIFVIQGILVGVVGASFGMIIGVVLVTLQKYYHLIPLDPTVYIIPAIPVELVFWDVLIVVATAVALSSMAALYPSRRAANLIPVEAIRWE